MTSTGDRLDTDTSRHKQTVGRRRRRHFNN